MGCDTKRPLELSQNDFTLGSRVKGVKYTDANLVKGVGYYSWVLDYHSENLPTGDDYLIQNIVNVNTGDFVQVATPYIAGQGIKSYRSFTQETDMFTPWVSESGQETTNAQLIFNYNLNAPAQSFSNKAEIYLFINAFGDVNLPQGIEGQRLFINYNQINTDSHKLRGQFLIWAGMQEITEIPNAGYISNLNFVFSQQYNRWIVLRSI